MQPRSVETFGDAMGAAYATLFIISEKVGQTSRTRHTEKQSEGSGKRNTAAVV